MESKHYSDQEVLLLNRVRPRKIFCFPDQLGWGYGYGSLAAALSDYSIYALTFLEEEDRLNRYIDIIKGIQPLGPYVFFGHSAAGRLSFEVTKALENKGCEVSDIIFADCFIIHLDITKEEERRNHTRFMVEEFLKFREADFLIEKVLDKAINHMLYLQTERELEVIDANVHLIISEEVQQHQHADLRCWEKLTTKAYRVYNGWGRHVDMFEGSALERNVKIIKKILKGITFGNE
jgi:thioesterase domain-containing protein